MTARHDDAIGATLRVDPVACDGVGICAHLAPDLVHADTWGYPIMTGRPVSDGHRRQAQAAVAACPRRALFIAG